jgi:hypothetical protein
LADEAAGEDAVEAQGLVFEPVPQIVVCFSHSEYMTSKFGCKGTEKNWNMQIKMQKNRVTV